MDHRDKVDGINRWKLPCNINCRVPGRSVDIDAMKLIVLPLLRINWMSFDRRRVSEFQRRVNAGCHCLESSSVVVEEAAESRHARDADLHKVGLAPQLLAQYQGSRRHHL